MTIASIVHDLLETFYEYKSNTTFRKEFKAAFLIIQRSSSSKQAIHTLALTDHNSDQETEHMARTNKDMNFISFKDYCCWMFRERKKCI